MVDERSSPVRIEIVPWLTRSFGHLGSSRLVFEEEVEQSMTLVDFLMVLAQKHPAFGQSIFNPESHELNDYVTIVHNNILLAPAAIPVTTLKNGDLLVFLPAFIGG